MNAQDVMKYGHRTVMVALDELTEAQADVSGVCGYWSVRQIMAHLASHEHVLADVLKSFLGETATPHLDAQLKQGGAFNDREVDKRKGMTYGEIVQEYVETQAEAQALIAQIPLDRRREVGAIPWYGSEYDLEDLIAYSNYAHKREHMAQVNVYKDMLKG